MKKMFLIFFIFTIIQAENLSIGINDSSFRTFEGCLTESCNESKTISTAFNIGFSKEVYQYNNNKSYVDLGLSYYILPISNNSDLGIFSFYTLQSYKLKNELKISFPLGFSVLNKGTKNRGLNYGISLEYQINEFISFGASNLTFSFDNKDLKIKNNILFMSFNIF